MDPLRGAAREPAVEASDGRAMRRDRVVRRILFAAALVVFAFGLWQQRRFVHDDAFISLRYAQRFLAGEGLTWNDGERVEGFSHPLWLAQTIVLGALGIPLPVAVRLLGLAYAAGVFVLWVHSRAHPLGLLLLVSLFGWPLWTLGGLETVGYCFLVLLGVRIAERTIEGTPSTRRNDERQHRGLWLGLALSAVGLMRPEGIGVAAALIVAVLLARRRAEAAIALCVFLAVTGGYHAFRWIYFGDWLATAARAKVTGLPLADALRAGIAYVASTAGEAGGTVVAALAMIAASPERRRSAALALAAVPMVAVIVVGGGDHMPGGRFVLPLAALLCFLGGRAMIAASGARRAALTAAVLVVASWQTVFTWAFPMPRDAAAAVGEIVGRELERRLPAGALVATATAGSMPYFAPSLSFLDTLGLNDPFIARSALVRGAEGPGSLPGHRKGNAAYVLSRRPDVILLGTAEGILGRRPIFAVDASLLEAPNFRARYAPFLIWAPVLPEERSHPRVARLLDSTGSRIPVTVYLLDDAPAAGVLREQATRLVPPWQSR